MTETPAQPVPETTAAPEAAVTPEAEAAEVEAPARPRLDPTRYGDWEMNGKCVDF